MEDLRIKHHEELVGAAHPTKPDVINRLMLIEHGIDGKHKGGFFLMQVSATHIQWKHLYDEEWQNLIALADLIGDPGTPAENISLQKTETHVQWKLGDGEWQNLIALTDLTGPQGEQGDPGTPAENISLQKTETHVQWKLGDGEWQNLIALADLIGPQGAQGDPGEDATEIELQKTATHVQWRYVGGEWTNLIALADITGPPGGLQLGETSDTAYRGDRGKTAYDHSQAAHAPSNAQKNSDITKGEIEAKLTGEIDSHSHAGGGGGWQTVAAGDFTARPASTSTITMLADRTATIKPGMSLRYTWNSVEYFGQVAAITSNLLTVRGAPLSTSYDVTNLQFGGGAVTELCLAVNGLYEDADNTALLTSDNKSPLRWLKKASYAVHYRVWSRLKDTGGTAGKASVRINNAELNSSADGLTIAADATEYATAVDINASNYDIQEGELIEVTAKKGTNGDAEDLCVLLVIVTP